jgi:hypothetical protein
MRAWAVVLLVGVCLASCTMGEPVVVTEIITEVIASAPTSESELVVVTELATRVVTAVPSATPVWMTLDGWDPASQTTISPINIWKDYNDRAKGVAGTGRHGEQVRYIRRSGDGVLIETKAGVRGWVTYWFIKELK